MIFTSIANKKLHLIICLLSFYFTTFGEIRNTELITITMKITFKVKYKTSWGEMVKVMINDNKDCLISLSAQSNDIWKGTGDYFPGTTTQCITYRYCIYRNNECVRMELGAIPHSFCLGNQQQSHYIIDDFWRDLPSDAYQYSSAFNYPSDNISRQKNISNGIGSCITFRAICPGLNNHQQQLGISGGCNILGNWAHYSPSRMVEVQPNVWQITFPANAFDTHFEYKFVAVSNINGAVEEWELGENRTFDIQALQRGETYVSPEHEIRFERMSDKVAGSAIPVFSLRSEGSCGIGDFGDLKAYIEWAAMTHQKAVQILPINDTTMTGTWTDSYPYNSISIYAFNPIYIDIRQVPQPKDEAEINQYEVERQRLNSLPQMDYEGVYQLKRHILTLSYQYNGKHVLDQDDFKEFFNKNEHWLKPYAAFSYLRDLNHTSDFNAWPEHSVFVQKEIDLLCQSDSEAYPQIAFYYYLQYQLHLQLLAASQYARRRGVILKGDIPIGISRGSVEAWVEPHYFNMNGQAGAPPDAFSANGQNWEFPTYNWEEMEKDNYLWWRKRFAKMAEYFTAYRIDHILGFFRIWEIPTHSVHGLLGQFVPSKPMSIEEIRSFGLNFRKDFMTHPYIDDRILTNLFPDDKEYVIKTFLKESEDFTYSLKPEFDTQRKVESYFYHHPEERQSLKEPLYSLISNVLFIADRKEPNRYHPRIAVQNDYIFKELNSLEQERFNNLYDHYYYHRHNEFWYAEAMKKLPVLTQSTDMLVCGEDLGMVPECVPWLMKNLQILSLEIQRMPKAMWTEFGDVANYPEYSVCTIGSHDMSTLRGWWEEDRKTTAHFYHNVLHHEGEAPEHASDAICEEVVKAHLQSPSLLCILAWQDWMAIDERLRNPNVEAERINIPANPRHYWRWRMHITLERLMKETAFNEKMQSLIDASQRYHK